MTAQVKTIFEALLAGDSAQFLETAIAALSRPDRQEFLCGVCCLRDEIAANCQGPAEEADRLLISNGHRFPPSLCPIQKLRDHVVCPLIASPTCQPGLGQTSG